MILYTLIRWWCGSNNETVSRRYCLFKIIKMHNLSRMFPSLKTNEMGLLSYHGTIIITVDASFLAGASGLSICYSPCDLNHHTNHLICKIIDRVKEIDETHWILVATFKIISKCINCEPPYHPNMACICDDWTPTSMRLTQALPNEYTNTQWYIFS